MNYDEFALQAVRERRLLIDRLDAWLFEQIEPFIGQRILEVGCGLGNLLHHLLDRELVVGIDNAEAVVAQVNEVYAHYSNVCAITCDVTDRALLNLKHYQFDTAISFNVLEHIEEDLLTLERISNVLIPDGRLILLVPAHMFLYGTMDRSIGHFRRYTDKELTFKLGEAGFDVLIQRYVNPIGALGWLVNGRILHRKVPPVAQLKLFNRLIPFVIALENKLATPFGLSLLSVSQRVK